MDEGFLPRPASSSDIHRRNKAADSLRRPDPGCVVHAWSRRCSSARVFPPRSARIAFTAGALVELPSEQGHVMVTEAMVSDGDVTQATQQQ